MTSNLTADGKPDLVVFQDDCDDAVGASHWDAYPFVSNDRGNSPLMDRA